MMTFKNSSFSSKRFLVIENKHRQTSLWIYEPDIDPFSKKWSFKSIKHLTSWSFETSYELQSSFPHSTIFPDDLPPLDYHKRDGDATCKDYILISNALEYTPKSWEWTKDILKHYELMLERAHIQDTIFASLLTYDW